MNLEEYQQKRNFNESPEPTQKTQILEMKEPVFVVQKHQASHLHYDFRLQVDGVLKSWAIPKGPSMNPRDKRLAVMVEDHPLAYANFEGTIPEGNYGAGTVEIWDQGSYEKVEKHKSVSQAIEDGQLEFTLHGEKLKGLFALIRTHMGGKNTNWLLIKKKDEFALHNDS